MSRHKRSPPTRPLLLTRQRGDERGRTKRQPMQQPTEKRGARQHDGATRRQPDDMPAWHQALVQWHERGGGSTWHNMTQHDNQPKMAQQEVVAWQDTLHQTEGQWEGDNKAQPMQQLTKKWGAHWHNGVTSWQPDEMQWRRALAQWHNERAINVTWHDNQQKLAWQEVVAWQDTMAPVRGAMRGGEKWKPTRQPTKKEGNDGMMAHQEVATWWHTMAPGIGQMRVDRSRWQQKTK